MAKDNISPLVRRSVAQGRGPNCYNFAPPTNTYYRLIASLVPEDARKGLDVGCFLGDFSSHLVQRGLLAEVDCVDLSPAAIEHARKRHRDPRLRFSVGDAETYQPQGSYDVVLLMGILERFTLERVVAIMRNVHPHTRYVLVTFTEQCMRHFSVAEFYRDCRTLFRLKKQVTYTIREREAYEAGLRPQTNHHTFVLLGRVE